MLGHFDDGLTATDGGSPILMEKMLKMGWDAGLAGEIRPDELDAGARGCGQDSQRDVVAVNEPDSFYQGDAGEGSLVDAGAF
jgi:hypothetical protein